MSWKARIPSPRLTTVAGISPAATLQKMQATRVSSAPERLPELLPKLLADPLLGGRAGLDLRELVKQRPLLAREFGRRPNVLPHVEVATTAVAHLGQALAADAVDHPGLRARLDLERRVAVGRRHLDLGAERRLAEGDREVVENVVPVPLEARVLGDLEHCDQVAGRPVARAGHALAPHRQIMMVGDARRDVDLHRLLRADPSIAAALGAGVEDDGPFPGAAGAGRDRDELAEHGPGGASHLAAPAARAAGRRARARLRAGAAARRAALEGAHPDRLGGARGDLVERELESDLEILAAVAVPPRALAAAEEGIEPAQPAKVAHEDVERFRQVEVAEPEALARTATARPSLPVAVVEGALLGITQHLVRLRDLLEALFGGLVAVVAVGVILHGELAVGLLDVGLGSIAPHAQHRVVIARRLHSSSSLTSRLV